MRRKYILLLIITSFYFLGCFQFVLAAAPARNIFQKPTQVKNNSTTTKVEDEAKIQELIRILNQNATVTYPFSKEIQELQQSESVLSGVITQPNGWFSKILPYLLGLIVLLILVIIVVLLRWLRQESKKFFDLSRERLEHNKIIKKIDETKTMPLSKTTASISKSFVSQSAPKVSASMHQAINLNHSAGIINLKDVNYQKGKIIKRPKNNL